RPCLPRNLPVPIQNIIPASTSIQNTPLPENLTPIDNLISFDKNIPTYHPNVSNVPVVDFLTKKERFDLMESNNNEPSNSDPQAYHFLDLDLGQYNKEHCEVWQNGIQYAKDIFKVDGAKYAFSTWFTEIEKLNFEARMTEERAQRILNTIDNYDLFVNQKKAGGKYVRGGPNVILTKKTKPGFWLGIDKKFLVREVSVQSDVERLDSNAVVYGLYRIRKPDINRLMSMKDGALNCVAE
ncbi:37298_t:CDS:2, partial [Gigaspora margarita]